MGSEMCIRDRGKRTGCFYETLLYGALFSAAVVFYNRKSAFFKRKTALAFIGIGCGLFPAVAMQVGCMYVPMHGFLFHYLPPAVITCLAVIFGLKFLPKV